MNVWNNYILDKNALTYMQLYSFTNCAVMSHIMVDFNLYGKYFWQSAYYNKLLT